jgi:hypothetical protein
LINFPAALLLRGFLSLTYSGTRVQEIPLRLAAGKFLCGLEKTNSMAASAAEPLFSCRRILPEALLLEPYFQRRWVRYMKKVRGTQNSAFIVGSGAISVRLFYVIILLSEHIESAIDRKP